MKTTLNKIKEHTPCADGWAKLLGHLGKTKPDDEELQLLTILESNGYEDALWALRAVEGHDREIRLFAVRCARRKQHLMTDPRSVNALDVAELYANGEATAEELNAAYEAAYKAAAAADATRASAADAADAYAACTAPGAIYAATDAAAYAADAAAYAAYAPGAAYAAARAARAAAYAAYAADAVYDYAASFTADAYVAYETERAYQKAEFRKMIEK